MTEAYPLAWPAHWPRTQTQRRGPFKTSFAKSRDALILELCRLGATNIVISTNLGLRRNGLAYANQGQPDDTGVAVYFTLAGDQQCIPCDLWTLIQDNIQAIRKTVEALRGIERWGAKSMVKAAFAGFKALPAPEAALSWTRILQIPNSASLEEINRSYRARARLNANNESAIRDLNLAVEQARKDAT